MPRRARVVVPDALHHVTQRGNNQRDVFYSDGDRGLYLALLQDAANQHGVYIAGYCLMTNHVHLLLQPARPDALCKTLRRVHGDYARVLNVRRGESGHVWQSRYFSCAIDPVYMTPVLAYIERNPVRANMVRDAEDWHWSSARDHLGLRTSNWLAMGNWSDAWDRDTWKTVLTAGINEAQLQCRVREASQTGRPLGGAQFIRQCEYVCGISLARQKPGPKVREMGS